MTDLTPKVIKARQQLSDTAHNYTESKPNKKLNTIVTPQLQSYSTKNINYQNVSDLNRTLDAKRTGAAGVTGPSG